MVKASALTLRSMHVYIKVTMMRKAAKLSPRKIKDSQWHGN